MSKQQQDSRRRWSCLTGMTWTLVVVSALALQVFAASSSTRPAFRSSSSTDWTPGAPQENGVEKRSYDVVFVCSGTDSKTTAPDESMRAISAEFEKIGANVVSGEGTGATSSLTEVVRLFNGIEVPADWAHPGEVLFSITGPVPTSVKIEGEPCPFKLDDQPGRAVVGHGATGSAVVGWSLIAQDVPFAVWKKCVLSSKATVTVTFANGTISETKSTVVGRLAKDAEERIHRRAFTVQMERVGPLPELHQLMKSGALKPTGIDIKQAFGSLTYVLLRSEISPGGALGSGLVFVLATPEGDKNEFLWADCSSAPSSPAGLKWQSGNLVDADYYREKALTEPPRGTVQFWSFPVPPKARGMVVMRVGGSGNLEMYWAPNNSTATTLRSKADVDWQQLTPAPQAWKEAYDKQNGVGR